MRKIYWETNDYLKVIEAFPNIKFTYIKQIISGLFRRDLPYFSQIKSQWIFPSNYSEEKKNKFLTTIKEKDFSLKKIRIVDVAGEKNPRATLTNEQVLEIRRKGIYCSSKKLQEEYNASSSIMALILSGKTFKNLPYFDQKEIKWIYPPNWNNKNEKIILKNFLPQRSRYTFYEILKIRVMYNIEHKNLLSIKEELNMSEDKTTIYYIATGATWKNVPYFLNNKWIIPDYYNEDIRQQFNQLLSELEGI